MAESLNEALEGIFGDIEIDTTSPEDEDPDANPIDLLNKANAAFEQAQEELKDGNLGNYQDLIKKAEEFVSLAIELLNEK